MRLHLSVFVFAQVLLVSFAFQAFAFDECPSNSSIEVLWQGSWYDARFEAGPDAQGRCQIGYVGYGDEWDEWVDESRVRSAADATASTAQDTNTLCTVGAQVQVLWQGSWYDATVEQTRADGQCYIGYNGYGDEWDEWVGADRMRPANGGLCSVGAPIQVLWQGRWYNATVEQTRADGQCYIGYDGYGDEWDEWVGPERMRSRPQ